MNQLKPIIQKLYISISVIVLLVTASLLTTGGFIGEARWNQGVYERVQNTEQRITSPSYPETLSEQVFESGRAKAFADAGLPESAMCYAQNGSWLPFETSCVYTAKSFKPGDMTSAVLYSLLTFAAVAAGLAGIYSWGRWFFAPKPGQVTGRSGGSNGKAA